MTERVGRLMLAVAGLISSSIAFAAEQDPRRIEYFEKKIRPVLIEHCYECHSAEAVSAGKLKGGLQLDTREGLLKGGESGPALVVGKATASLLLKSLRFDGLEMPPKGQLPATVIADFEQWINDGAVDPREGQPVKVRPPINFEKAREFWSLRPLQHSEPPVVNDPLWSVSRIDRRVWQALEQHSLKPNPPADRGTLLRRLSLDLIGLPPTPQELADFLADTSPQAVERVVDRLLASPRYGEHWGRRWLDLARYSESCGSTRNVVWHHAWRYRDYVIQALNEDRPFDQFVREQLAGDLLPSDSDEARDRHRIAVGFLALGPKALDELKREVFRMDLIDEQIDTVSRVFLGLSVACARCHDHKFDPIPTRDYYALAGIFRSTESLYGPGPKGIKCQHDSDWQAIGADSEKLAVAAREHLERVKDLTQKRNDGRSSRYRFVRGVADLERRLKQAGADVVAIQADIDRQQAEIKNWDAKIAEFDKQLAEAINNPPPQPAWAMSAREAKKCEDCRIHLRGEITNLSDSVPRGTLGVIPVAMGTIAPEQSGRLQLAQWLTDRSHPLTSRVFVNRIWQHLFGQGLVSTPDDFGINGARPSHPELLDDLAGQFMSDGWSIKRLIRSIVLTQTYQQASTMTAAGQATDPENVWLWRMRPRRATAEVLHDSVLAVTGQLNVAPVENSVVGKLHLFKEDEFFDFSLKLKPEQLQHQHRAVYLPIVRGNLPEPLKLFDFADPSRPVGQRAETIVPAQSAWLVNGPWMLRESQHLAARLRDEVPDNESDRLKRLYLLALSREPSGTELARGLEFVAQAPELVAAGKPMPVDTKFEAWISLCHAVLASAEFRYVK